MKFITDYRELEGNPDESLLDHISETPINGKELVLQYLENGIEDGVRCSSIYDYVKGFSIGKTIHLFTDNEYYWTSEEIFLFQNYNLELKSEFIRKVVDNRVNV